MLESSEYLKKEVIGIVSDAFGEETTDLFIQYCEKRSPREILLFLRDLLKDFFGVNKTESMIATLAERYQINKP
jgi:hypothetical protein